MIIKPMVRSNICLNAHPTGCVKEVERQINYVKSKKSSTTINNENAPKCVLVLGCSTGYGLASRITVAFEYGAETIGVSFEKEGTATKGGTPGFYNNLAFDEFAKKEGIYSKTFNADAFLHETRKMVIDEVKKQGKKFDLVVYSLASPVRSDPDKIDEKTGQHVLFRSVIKPIDKPFAGKGIDLIKKTLFEGVAEPATQDEIEQTIKVMGGEDWELWINQLNQAGVLANGCKTVAYSYIGPKQSHPIYRDGTIGQAKKHLEKTAHTLNETLSKIGGSAFVSVNKGLVTRSSAVIPIISLYLSVLFKVMKSKGLHEGCIEQMERLFSQRLYTQDKKIPVDEENRIRIDDWEMSEEVQTECDKYMQQINETNFMTIGDFEGYKHDFYAVNGFDIEGVDYEKDIENLSGSSLKV